MSCQVEVCYLPEKAWIGLEKTKSFSQCYIYFKKDNSSNKNLT